MGRLHQPAAGQRAQVGISPGFAWLHPALAALRAAGQVELADAYQLQPPPCCVTGWPCRYNTFWSVFESSPVMPSYSPLTCPSGYLMVRLSDHWWYSKFTLVSLYCRICSTSGDLKVAGLPDV